MDTITIAGPSAMLLGPPTRFACSGSSHIVAWLRAAATAGLRARLVSGGIAPLAPLAGAAMQVCMFLELTVPTLTHDSYLFESFRGRRSDRLWCQVGDVNELHHLLPVRVDVVQGLTELIFNRK